MATLGPEARIVTPTSCPKCQSAALRWITVRRQVPIDLLQCQTCGVAILEEDWYPPLVPMVPGRCINCGDKRDFDHCINCGLTREEDSQVHDELREVIAPDQNQLEAARTAVRSGRNVLALKLATAAASQNENNQGDVARALRIWLLGRLSDPGLALDDARAWVENVPDPSALAWATYGQQLQAEYPGSAAEAYEKALKKDRSLHQLRARRASLLMVLHREGQAYDEVCRVLEMPLDDATCALALSTAEQLADIFEGEKRDDEIDRLIDRASSNVEKSAILLAHRARLYAIAGDASSAKLDLKKARKINPELPIYERVERAMKGGRTSWWRW